MGHVGPALQAMAEGLAPVAYAMPTQLDGLSKRDCADIKSDANGNCYFFTASLKLDGMTAGYAELRLFC